MRKIVLLLSTLAAALLLASGVALADHLVNTVFCPTDPSGYCEGTDESDHMYGTNGPTNTSTHTAETTKSMHWTGMTT